jgi:two-component system cell cycle response regulator DivK
VNECVARNATRGTVLADHCVIAKSSFARLRGLLGTRGLPRGHGLLLRPCKQVHTFFMQYELDLVFVDAGGAVLLALPEFPRNRVSPKVRGAVAVLELPAGTLAETPTAPGDLLRVEPWDRLAERGSPMGLKKILVVEDNEDNRRILVYRLRKIGQFDIREAANGQQAIDAMKADRPDLIFMDLKMPVMDGWEATKRIRQMEGGDTVRIIALTAQAMAGDEQKALAIGCDDYLAKPVVDPDLVRQKLERLIGPPVAA